MSRFSQGVLATVAPRSRRGSIPALAIAACALAIVAALAVGTSAAKVPSTQVVLGQTSTVPDPSCPGLPCQAIGSVTGFQVSNGQTRSPFIVPHDGTIKAWTLTLAQPTNKQRSFFNGFFGTPPEARLAILRRISGTNPPRYNLRSQGSVKVLTPYLGQTVKFGSSLKVEKGDIVGITVPTWAPSFSQELASNEVWRASRAPGTCTNSTDIRQGEPLEKPGTRATFGCKYSTARLLYTATLVEGP
jgi:hypothetical protein